MTHGQSSGWSETLTKGIAAEVRRYRERQGLSAQQFADACTERGLPMKRSVIANFENGRRASVGVDELLVFAAVLKVPPVYLVIPVGRVEDIEAIPGDSSDPYRVALWFAGDLPYSKDDGYEDTKRLPLVIMRHIMLELGYLQQVRERIEAAEDRYEAFSEGKDLVEQADRAVRRMTELTEQMEVASAALHELVGSGNGPAILETRDRQKELLRDLTSARHELDVANRDAAKSLELKSEIASNMQDYEYIEEEIRKDLKELRSGGWVLPRLPAEYKYLADPEGKTKDRNVRYKY